MNMASLKLPLRPRFSKYYFCGLKVFAFFIFLVNYGIGLKETKKCLTNNCPGAENLRFFKYVYAPDEKSSLGEHVVTG